MCGFIFLVAVPPPHCENQTYNQHQGCARGILLKCSHICTNEKRFTSRVADIFHCFIFIIISQTLTEEFIPCIDLLTTFKTFVDKSELLKFQCTSKFGIPWMKHWIKAVAFMQILRLVPVGQKGWIRSHFLSVITLAWCCM